ncbi:tRNA 2-selenouridine(34) synthase MnmH [Saccharibacillus alkalitolerans]|uniref:tRNA 2-selenouridine(34) synthase MnmH n=1 Tax=Saccharibacillus alkalitolerans TaxID=2705290 RepID=A0ABX0F3I3_9BACL|nr:tRNA 2-selenouridine(34) synthase MnmH [Saccharibacillus alkalitolerans]NGZ75182.1 tRNA 2-selenouridine(34) synthase MnmH [Saccharibacillus alkalitolerans]
MFQDITIEELLAKRASGEISTIDVRSPSEYRSASIPGSVNIPLFDDEERAEVGTLYKQVGVEQAKDRGLQIASAKLPEFVRQFKEVEGQKAVFCWRGGMRSRTTATVLDLMGIRAYRLNGGFRAYRKWVVGQLDTFELNARAFVLNGNTGNGKTAILHRLREEGYPVIDLEGMAGHRGSVFGGIGVEARNQKTFDALLLERLMQIGDAPYILLEAESKRIGKVEVPAFLMKKKEQGVQLRVELPMEERIRHIIEDYRPEEHAEACMASFLRIKEHIHQPIAADIHRLMESGEYADAVRMMLEFYYDPKYEYSEGRLNPEATLEIRTATAEEAAERIKDILAAEFGRPNR